MTCPCASTSPGTALPTSIRRPPAPRARRTRSIVPTQANRPVAHERSLDDGPRRVERMEEADDEELGGVGHAPALAATACAPRYAARTPGGGATRSVRSQVARCVPRTKRQNPTASAAFMATK